MDKELLNGYGATEPCVTPGGEVTALRSGPGAAHPQHGLGSSRRPPPLHPRGLLASCGRNWTKRPRFRPVFFTAQRPVRHRTLSFRCLSQGETRAVPTGGVTGRASHAAFTDRPHGRAGWGGSAMTGGKGEAEGRPSGGCAAPERPQPRRAREGGPAGGPGGPGPAEPGVRTAPLIAMATAAKHAGLKESAERKRCETAWSWPMSARSGGGDNQ